MKTQIKMTYLKNEFHTRLLRCLRASEQTDKLQNITRDKSRNSDPRTLTNELLRRWNDKDVLVVIVILIIIHVVIQVEKEHSPDLTADVAHQQPPGSNLAGWIFLQRARLRRGSKP